MSSKYKNPQEKRKIIIEYIRKNHHATYNSIRKHTQIHPERIFKKGLSEAFRKAGVKLPRTFKFKTKEERQKIIINYIKKHPQAGGHTIAKDTKINVATAFKNIKEAYEKARIKYKRDNYPRTQNEEEKNEKRKRIIEIIKQNPLITISELMKKSHTQPYNLFKNINEIYKKAGIKKIKGHKKWKLKKKQEIIKFIKENPLSTQREINQNCKTHVQDLFNKGIFEAYNNAKIEFPFERLKLYGIGIKNIRDRAKIFEKEIAIKLSGYGKVNRLVKTKRGFADIILERKNKKVVIEIKDYQNKDISMSQIKQLNRYLEDCQCNLGFLICHKKPKKDKFLINKNKIFILEKKELKKIPKLIDGTVG